MAKLLDNEYSMVSFKARKGDKEARRNTIINIILNIFVLEGKGGSGTKEFMFTLTNNHLYIDDIGYDLTGQVDIYLTEKFDRKDIKSFKVRKEGNKEIISLVTTNGKTVTYVRDNENASDLATEMAKLIIENAGN
ncbi:hypothetical protein [Clostridium sp. YIM B02500]|uniref:hypothetical protein n=1 Tax=Clostridium sp. YIM B02500 TaxID=2910681 RepID=UPI001EEE05C7|nr:hypothetical protein [Clostridium sp. YIM B02500]